MGKIRLERTASKKTCWKCRALKPFSKFYKSQTVCIPCGLKLNREWCLSNQHLRRIHRRRYYRRHKKKVLERGKLYRQSHPEVNKRAVKKWRRNNLKLAKRLIAEWAKRNRDKRNFSRHQRVYLKKATSGGNKISFEQWQAVKKDHNFRCHYCSMRKKLHMDHVVALTDGGEHRLANIVPACVNCNSRKGNRDYWEFLARQL